MAKLELIEFTKMAGAARGLPDFFRRRTRGRMRGVLPGRRELRKPSLTSRQRLVGR
jgi:hypothetical protein